MKRFVKMTAFCIVMTLIAAMFCLPAQAADTTEAKTIISSGSVGTGTGKQTTLVDFTASDLCGFAPIGNTAEPTFVYSNNWKANVLHTRINSAEAETGIRGTLAKASLLQGASSLSVRILAQYTKTTTHDVILRLEGLDNTGAPLILEAAAEAPVETWQVVTFDISAFVASANSEAPCTITILTSSDAEDEEFSLWFHSLYTSSLDSFPEFIIPVAATACGLIVGFALFFVIYRATCQKNRRRQGEIR
ncbi:MAG: hypothetical protein E7584_05100 [Ruminococcaceae bacterium]|nr:hypothetical protein [Oscillospiraceae bacterium]